MRKPAGRKALPSLTNNGIPARVETRGTTAFRPTRRMRSRPLSRNPLDYRGPAAGSLDQMRPELHRGDGGLSSSAPFSVAKSSAPKWMDILTIQAVGTNQLPARHRDRAVGLRFHRAGPPKCALQASQSKDAAPPDLS